MNNSNTSIPPSTLFDPARALAIKRHPHGGFTIARPVSVMGSTAMIYEGQFPSPLAARTSDLFRSFIGQAPLAPTANQHAHAASLFSAAAALAERARGHMARAYMRTHGGDLTGYRRWARRAELASLGVRRLLKWADAAQFEALKSSIS